VSFAAITLCVASQRVFIVINVYFVIDSIRKLLDTSSHARACVDTHTLIESLMLSVLLVTISAVVTGTKPHFVQYCYTKIKVNLFL
jgi:hypothetical protein